MLFKNNLVNVSSEKEVELVFVLLAEAELD